MRTNKNRLWLEMMRCCMDVKTLAASAKLPPKTVYKALHGDNVRPITLGKIAKALCIDPAELIEQEVAE